MRKTRLRVTAAMLTAATALLGGAFAAPAHGSGAHALIQGSGSSWAALSVEQWIADVQRSGLQVVFNPSGSAQGRKDFANKTVDFAVSDIGFLGTDPATGLADTNNGRAYAYLPIVAGGTAMPYHILKAGKLVRTLRLSGSTIAKIFTNKITNWNDSAITADNNGVSMPSLPIIPVVHSEGSGSSYQFTRYLWKQYGSTWTPFGGNYATEYFPRQGHQVAENGSDSIMNYISSTNGAIGYDEYSYALAKNFPVVKVLNPGGYYTLPNQYNVAVALTKAQINMDKSSPDYLLQVLDGVYTFDDPRSYPMSSYSYMIIPTANNDPTMSTAKRQTLADYLFWSICGGQKEMGPIGYSPLPINLVQASFQQTDLLHAADPNVNLSNEDATHCDNPTFDPANLSRNKLAEIAPQPASCDKQGAGPCTGTVDTGLSNPIGNHAGGSSNGATGGNSNGTGGGSNPNGSSSGHNGPGNGGQQLSPGSTASAGSNQFGDLPGSNAGNDAAAQNALSQRPISGSQSKSSDILLGVIIGALLVGLLLAPPLIAQRVKGAGQGT